MDSPALRDTLLPQPMSLDTRSREFSDTLTSILASREGVDTAMSLQGDHALVRPYPRSSTQARTIGAAPSSPPHRLLAAETWNLTSGQRASASSRKSAVRRPSYHVLTFSRTSQSAVTSHSLPEGSQMFGKASAIAIACAWKRSVSILPKTFP